MAYDSIGKRVTVCRSSVRIWYRIHKWNSLICTAFLLMSCLTGLPLIFDEQIDHITDQHVKPASLPQNAPFASIDGVVSASKQLYPNEHVLSLGWDDDEPRVFLNMAWHPASIRSPTRTTP